MINRCINPDRPGSSATLEQSVVIDFLSNPLSYDPAPPKVERLETHGALIFLAGQYAYKLKRAVKLAYLDFSTLEKRQAVCRNELIRNKDAAPEIYIAVRPIVRQLNGQLSIGGDGEPVDWVVVMKRFAAESLFDNLARDGQLEVSLMAPLADTIARYHAAAKPVYGFDGDDRLAAVITQITQSLQDHPELIDQSRGVAVSESLLRELDESSALLRARAQAGFVRLCHGDLHLQNIVLWNERPTLFDALEFDDRLATIDVLYDLAFLVMDLCHRGLDKHANLCFGTYVARAMTTDALSGLAALPLFLSVRAAIRAVVTLDRLELASERSQNAKDGEIDAYLSLAEQFLRPSAPQFITIGGFSGTGKSTLASAIAPAIGTMPGALHLRSDVERKLMAGVDPLDRLPKAAYTNEMSERVYRILAERAEAALAAGQSVIVDAVFNEPKHRREMEDLARRQGVELQGLWLAAPKEILIERVAKRKKDASDADVNVVRDQLTTGSGPTTWLQVDASATPDVTAKRAMSMIEASPCS